jgi:hypothetical protein
MHGTGNGFWLFFFLIPLIALRLREEYDLRTRQRAPHRDGGVSAGGLLREADIYRLARRLGGILTVSDLIVESGVSVATAESSLERLVDGLRVRIDVTDHGIVRYEFHEFLNRRDGETELQFALVPPSKHP